MLDKWSFATKRLHPTFSGPEFMAKLALVSQVLWKDISRVEAKHATIRRLLVAASLQTHPQAVQDLSAQWVFLQARKSFQRMKFGKAKASAKPKKVVFSWVFAAPTQFLIP